MPVHVGTGCTDRLQSGTRRLCAKAVSDVRIARLHLEGAPGKSAVPAARRLSLEAGALLARQQPRDVAHLAPGADGAFAVKMQMRGRVGDGAPPGLDLVADQVLHHRDGGLLVNE